MTLLITGSNGFLGKNIKKVFDENNLAYLAPSSKELNLTSYNSVIDYFDRNRPSKVLHLAAICGGILANKNSPADFVQLNNLMTVNIFEAVRKYDIEYLYTAGSVCGYPKNCQVPFKEDNLFNGEPESTNAPYGQAKRLLFVTQRAHMEQYGLKGAHLIPVNMYGKYDHFDLVSGHVIPALIKKFIFANTIGDDIVECWGTGQASREFLFVEDCAQAFYTAITQKLNTQLPINIGTGKEITIKKLAETISDLTNFTGDILFTGYVSDGQPRRCLDISRAKELMGFQAKTSLSSGLKQTIDWYNDYKKEIIKFGK